MKIRKEKICQNNIIPVVVINDACKAVPAAKALLAGGIKVIEITFRTAAARRAIAEVCMHVPGMLVGAGTIINTDQLDQALEAGAKFIVSPGLNVDLIKAAHAKSVMILPGAVTPTEIMQGLELGIQTFKFFPSENYGGLNTINALAAPFAEIDFIPTGGISAKNLAGYMQNKRVAAIGGSWMATSEMIDSARYDDITSLTLEAMSIVNSIRS